MTKLCNPHLYYVGGCLRDEIIGIPSFDVDYCFEGNAIEEFTSDKYDVVKVNPSFGTVRIRLEDVGEIDIASTREENYPRKGHLPEVFNIGCSLKSDLKRRDFTINTLARSTASNGELVDYYDAQGDIEKKLLRVLHEESFIDDPSRIIRGLKFSVRLGFSLEEKTKELQDEYLANINYDMSYHRLKKELVETFSLNKQKAYDEFVNQGIYKLLAPNQEIHPIKTSIEDFINQNPTKHAWLIYLAQFDLSRLELTRQEKKILEWAERLKTEKPTNNTPFESVLINKLQKEN